MSREFRDVFENSTAIVSSPVNGGVWEIGGYVQGHTGAFPFEPHDNGYV